jgi:hypothetical protein
MAEGDVPAGGNVHAGGTADSRGKATCPPIIKKKSTDSNQFKIHAKFILEKSLKAV